MADRRRIYLDTCCFIDLVKQEVGLLPNDRTADVWFLKKILQANRDGAIEVFSSVITIAEAVHADGRCDEKVKIGITKLLNSGQYLRLVQPTPFIAEAARDLKWIHGASLKGADAIHAASALELKCEEMVTTDTKISNATNKPILEARGLKVIRAQDSLVLPIAYKQYTFPEDEDGDQEDPTSQLDKFKELARELEADEDEAAWDERLKKVVEHKPQAETPEGES